VQINPPKIETMPIVEINGPVVATETSGFRTSDYIPGLIYSIQLETGTVITSPSGFEVLSLQKSRPHKPDVRGAESR
jgi:hypothetical protein